MDATRKLAIALLAGGSAWLLVLAGLSLSWRIKHDAALMLYFAYLIEHLGYVPYRDFFEHQPPGAHAVYALAGRLFGYSDLGFRLFDLTAVAALLATTFAWLSRFSRTVAWTGCVLFGLAYLGRGPVSSAQRDFLLLLPLSAALWLHLGFPRLDERLRALLAGVLLGLPLTVKPQIAIAIPALLAYQAWRLRGAERAGERAAWLLGAAACALPTAVAALALWRAGALAPFVEIVRDYYPLFGSLDGSHTTIAGLDRLRAVAEHYPRFGGHFPWLAPASLGIALGLARTPGDSQRRGAVALLAALCVLASAYPIPSGRFWPYHWLPFLYFAVAASALCALPAPPRASAARRWLPLLLVTAVAVAELEPSLASRRQLAGEPMPPPSYGRADQMAGFLRDRLEPGDTVQALDWTGGAIHAMLMTGARPATPYLTDFSFYHHVSTDAVRGLRRDFIASFTASPPRFVLEVYRNKPWPKGEDTSREFPELEHILARDYRVAMRGGGFRIHERLRAAE